MKHLLHDIYKNAAIITFCSFCFIISAHSVGSGQLSDQIKFLVHLNHHQTLVKFDNADVLLQIT